jgi:hypothetical protein
MDGLVAMVRAPRLHRWAHALLQTTLLIGLAYPVQATSMLARYCRQSGWGYAWAGWAHSPMIAYLKGHPLPGQIVSNDAWAVDILTGIPACAAPAKYYYHSYERDPAALPRFQRKLASGKQTYLVWFQLGPSYFYPVNELRSLVRLSPLAQFPEGTIYRVLTPDTPEMRLEKWKDAHVEDVPVLGVRAALRQFGGHGSSAGRKEEPRRGPGDDAGDDPDRAVSR